MSGVRKRRGEDPPTPGAEHPAETGHDVLDDFRGRHLEVHYHFVQCLSEHLFDCNRVFGGDFGQLIILAVLGQRFIHAIATERNAPDLGRAMVWMSALRLADVTGMPRETVRRKLRLMVDRGWVRHDAGKGWTLAGTFPQASAADDLADLDRRGMERLARLYAALNSVLRD